MRIGIDFDNTIACYDGVFHRAAVERGIIPPDLPTNKTSVRNYLRNIGREGCWTELQGYVYGARMDLVTCYPGSPQFLRRAVNEGHSVFVISHKTRRPYRGEQYDLHETARRFLGAQKIIGPAPGDIAPERVFFELTLTEKLARIAAQQCDVFVDDLPEFLCEDAFPVATRGILFDPENHYPGGMWKDRRLETYPTWSAIADALLGRAT